MNLGPQGSAEYGEEIKVPLKRVQGNGGEVKVGEVKVRNMHYNSRKFFYRSNIAVCESAFQ